MNSLAGKWQLVSGRLPDLAECLVLKMPTGEAFCEYAPGEGAYKNFWHSYYKGFPKRGFVSREACIEDAQRIAGHELQVLIFEPFQKTGDEK